MKLVNVPFELLLGNDNYVIGVNAMRGKITGFSSIPDGKFFQQLINVTWEDGRNATYDYPEEVGNLTVDASQHDVNLSSWVKFRVNRLNRHIKFLKKSIVSINEDDRYE